MPERPTNTIRDTLSTDPVRDATPKQGTMALMQHDLRPDITHCTLHNFEEDNQAGARGAMRLQVFEE